MKGNKKVIAIIGPPHSGKSIFTYELFLQSLSYDFDFTNNNMFVIKAAPDGEGLWTRDCDENYVKYLRVKGKFSNAYVSSLLEDIVEISKLKQVVLVDLGGKMSSENKQILSKCSHAIFVFAENNIDKYDLWEKYVKEANSAIQILAKVKTYLCERNRDPQIDKMENGLYEIQLWNVSRENKDIIIPKQFIHHIININRR